MKNQNYELVPVYQIYTSPSINKDLQVSTEYLREPMQMRRKKFSGLRLTQ